MRKIILVSTLIISTLSAVSAQEQIPTSGDKDKPTEVSFEKPRPEWKDKLRYGGNFWLGFFNSFYIDVSPMVGYELNQKGTVAGVGANFIYQGTFNRNSSTNTNDFTYGPKVFVRQQVFKRFFAHAEYEFIRAYADQFYSYIPDVANPTSAYKKKWGGSPLIGAGFYQGGDGRHGSFISVMYNLGFPNNGFISPQGILGNQSPITLRYGFLF